MQADAAACCGGHNTVTAALQRMQRMLSMLSSLPASRRMHYKCDNLQMQLAHQQGSTCHVARIYSVGVFHSFRVHL